MKLKDLFKRTSKKTRWTEAENLINKQQEEKEVFNKYLFDLVYDYKTKSEFGFNSDEQKEILKNFPNINKDKYSNALNGITCMMNEEKQFIIYHCDILTALHCGLENRDIKVSEWD